ncbi:bifunctional adenosylcobinamide kinase/adenosylcobinamide-phosphate guanylyltransferase [Thermogemmatispora sp.]|uniref:bifunctional adenosylcobinamide kinase/adenosylcobinamide-phosphate guanylyltransferase n=1 Tax=Thermogemmatispora sp. TaxID=1968838 RepID=UPI0035E4444A
MSNENVTDQSAIAQLTFILGGARSGKSRFALRLAAASGRQVAFIATATASDQEMAERIRRHQAERPKDWYTIEEPVRLDWAIQQAARVADVLLLDCLTLWLNNLLLAHQRPEAEIAPLDPALEAQVLEKVERLLGAARALQPHQKLIVVSNEVGLGLVPFSSLGRGYRDLLGLVNQRLAEAAAQVYLLIAGLPLDLKRWQAETSAAGPDRGELGL